jgi:hypothetical protein
MGKPEDISTTEEVRTKLLSTLQASKKRILYFLQAGSNLDQAFQEMSTYNDILTEVVKRLP